MRQIRCRPAARCSVPSHPKTMSWSRDSRLYLGTARRIDLVERDSSGNELLRLEDVPFHAQRGEIILSECVPHVRTLPSHMMMMKLMCVDDRGERPLAEYTFHHKASSGNREFT